MDDQMIPSIWQTRTRASGLSAAGFAVVLASCDPGLPKIDEKPFLDNIGFGNSISVTINLAQPVDDSGYLLPNNESALTALLVQTGAVGIGPNAEKSPWWGFTASGNRLAQPVGKRLITSRSEQRAWEEGDIEYYAETITYEIRPIQPVPGWMGTGPFSFRLVLRNDPAVGAWRVLIDPSRGTTFSDADGETVAQRLGEAGRVYVPELRQKIEAAREAAFTAIERSIAAEGIAEKTASADVLLSRRSRLLYFKGIRTTQEPLTLTDLQNYCAEQKAENAAWRLPTMEELRAMFRPRGFMSGQATIVDTPDRRLWGDLSMPRGPGLVIPTSTAAYAGFQYGPAKRNFRVAIYQIAIVGRQFVPTFRDTTMYAQGPDLGSARIEYKGDLSGNKQPLQVICVAAATST